MAVASGLLVAASAAPVSAQQSATMLLKGPTSSPTDQTFDVEIRVQTSVSVNAVQADITFPTNLLAYQSASGAGSAFSADLISNSANGNVSIVRAKIGGGSGDMLVSTLTFKAVKDGRAELRLLDSSMATDSETSENVVKVRQGLTVTIGNASPSDPVQGGTELTPGSVQPNDPNNASPSVTPTVDPELDNVTGNGEAENTTTFGSRDNDAAGISPVAWSLMGMSVLLIAVSAFFGVNILKRRGRRMAAYQNYLQPPIGPMYNQGQFYNLNNAGYTAQSTTQQNAYQQTPYQQQNPYQQPAVQQRNPYQSQYIPQQYPMRQGYPQMPTQPIAGQQPYQPTAQPQQTNQYPWQT